MFDDKSKLIETIADSLPVLVSVLDTEFRYIYANKAYEAWFKVKLEDIIGKSVKDFVGEVVFNRALPHFKKALEGETVIFEQESPYASGTRHIHVMYVPLRDKETNKVIGIIAHVDDVSKRIKEEEIELKRQEKREHEFQRLLGLFEDAPLPMALLSGADHKFVFANKQYRKRFIKTDYLNKSVLEVIPEAKEQGFISLLDEVYRTGKPYIGNERSFYLEQDDGSVKEFFFNFIYQAVLGEKGNIFGVLAVISDVTDLVKTSNELIAQRDLRERFVSTLTHDLKTPLMAARLSTHLMLKKIGEPQAIQDLASRLDRSLRRVEHMVRDLLDANLINVGQGLPITKKEQELNILIDETMLDLVYVHGNRFVFHKKQNAIYGYWDGDAIKRIIDNLINNGIKYGSPDGVITIETNERTEDVVISVHNTGNPIPKNELNLLFVKYKRASTAVESGKGGWGIGLSLVKGLVEAHGGNVSVKSSESEGTTFTIILPKK